MGSLKVMKQAEIDVPPILKLALPDELFDKLKMKRYPVLILKPAEGDAGGWCHLAKYTEFEEIVLCEDAFDFDIEDRFGENQIEGIRYTYLHECAHRLFPTGGHGAGFLSMEMLLCLRADDDTFKRIKFYDFHEGSYPAESWEWAWKLAHELAPTDITAVEASATILERLKEWIEWMENSEERKALSKKRAQGFNDEFMAMKKQVAGHGRANLEHGLIGFIVGMIFYKGILLFGGNI